MNPNGGEIALMSTDEQGDARLYLVLADGSKRKEVTPHKGSFAHPAWSPDGELLLYDRTLNQRCNLYVVDRRTGIETRLTCEDSAAVRFASFAPNAKAVVFVKQDRNGQNLFIGSFELGTPSKQESLVVPARDTGTRVLPDTTRPAVFESTESQDSPDRSRYKIVIFSDDDALAEEFMSLLRDKGYTSPESYVAPSPNARATIKHNDAPDVVVEELTDLVNLHLNLRLESLNDPQIPETSIYINLP